MSTAPELEPDAVPLENAKPAFLRRVRIRGYKSIAFCDVTLEPLTILVGRNASGKSNFLDALGFLKDLADTRVTDAVKSRGGWRSIHHRGDARGMIEMELEATVQSFRSVWDVSFSFVLGLGEHNQVRVKQESLLLTQHGNGRQCGYQAVDGDVAWIGHEHFDNPFTMPLEVKNSRAGSNDKLRDPRFYSRAPDDRLFMSVGGSQPFIDLAEGFRASLVCNFSPPAIRSLEPRIFGSAIGWDGRDLANAIERLHEIEPQDVQRIERYLAAIVDGVEGFQTVKYGEFETVQFRVTNKSGQPPHLFDAASMSDGTLRVLAALIAVHEIYLPTAATGFVGIEEPETSLHPAAMRALVDAFDEATLRKQILLTTHSAEMLDNPTIKPENIRVVQMIDGQTVITPVDEASVEIVRRKLNTLGGLERENQLEPNLDDLDRQRQLGLILGSTE